MRSLVDVLEDATRRSAFEVIFGSGHAAVFTTPWGRELARQVAPGAQLYDMLSAVISNEQQIELAVGNPVELELDVEHTRWVLRAKSGSEGISIHASCAELAAAAAEQRDDDAPVPRRAHPSSTASLLDIESGSETSGVPFDDCWGGEDSEASAPFPSAEQAEDGDGNGDGDGDDEDGSPVFVAASDSTIQGLPDSSEALPTDAVVLIPEAWVQAGEQLASERERERAQAEAEAGAGQDEEEVGGDAGGRERSAAGARASSEASAELEARIAEQATIITALQAQLARYEQTFARHDKAIRQLHKRLRAVERGDEAQ